MDFLGIGPGELLLILTIALIVFGPRRLPEIGRALGTMIREFRQASQELTTQLRSDMDAASGERDTTREISRSHAPDTPTASPGSDSPSEESSTPGDLRRSPPSA